MDKYWKYAMILCRRGDFEEDPIHLLVELYNLEHGPFFHEARLSSPEELEMAYKDVKSDGINYWFYDNGKFKWDQREDTNNFTWHWTPNEVTD